MSAIVDQNSSGRLRRNFVANVAGMASAGFLQLIFTPVYLRVLGLEAYGLIGFYVTLLAVIQIFDFGVSPTLNREMARYSALPDRQIEARNLARTLEALYWLAAAVIGLAITMASRSLARGWFPEAHLSQMVIGQAIAVMGVVCSFQWLIGFYQSGLIGLQKQVALNVVRTAMAVVSTGGAVLVLTTISPTISAFFLWLLCASFLQLGAYAFLFWKCMPPSRQRPRVAPSLIRGVWRFAAGMAGLTACGAFLMQADKLVVSRMLPLATFGTYSLASLVASGLLVITSPLFNTMFPQFSALVASSDETRLRDFYHSCAQTAAVFVLSAGCVVAFFSRELLFVWTGNAATARAAAPIVTLLVIGTALNGLMSVPYALQLAHGWTRLGLTIAASEVVIVGPLLVVLAKNYGVLGAAAVWPLLNAVYIAVAIPMTHRRILRKQGSIWFVHDVLPPLMAAVAIAASARAIGFGSASRVESAALLALVSVVTLAGAAAAAPRVRASIRLLVPGGRTV